MDTPSIDVIRHWVAWDNDEHDYQRVLWFEDWLAATILAERERIIALLEAERCGYLSCPDEDCHNCEMPINEVIALIKGDVVERRQMQVSEYGDKGEVE